MCWPQVGEDDELSQISMKTLSGESIDTDYVIVR